MQFSGVRPGHDLAVRQRVGTSGLRFPVHSEASELLTMGKSIMPNNEGQLDNVLLCTVVSKRKLGAGVRCTSVL